MASDQTSKPKPRLDFLDSVRNLLTILVIYMHTAVAYGGTGSWAYISKAHPPSAQLEILNGLAQMFYMAAFFLISGFFSRISLERKPAAEFVKGKLIRLGIPTAVYTLVGPPLQTAIMRVLLEKKSLDIQILLDHVRNLHGIRGAVWYCALLLIFDCLHALKVAVSPIRLSSHLPSFTFILLGITSSIVLSFCVRIVLPCTYVWPPMNLRIGYVPQYALAYILGLSIRHIEIWDPLPSPMVWLLSAATIITIPVSALALSGPTRIDTAERCGGLNRFAASYAVTNETLGYLLFATVFKLCRAFVNKRSMFSRYAYGAFLLHPIVSVAIEAALDGWMASAGTKLVAVGTMNVCASWAAAWALLKIPGTKMVI